MDAKNVGLLNVEPLENFNAIADSLPGSILLQCLACKESERRESIGLVESSQIFWLYWYVKEFCSAAGHRFW